MRARLVVSLAVISACGGDPHVLNGFRSPMGVNGLRPKAHSGVDFKGEQGDPVLAAADGVVVGALDDGGAGKSVLLGHGAPDIRRAPLPPRYPRYTVYLHLSQTDVSRGQQVKRGDVIGRVGATGWASGGIPHVHIQVCTFPCATGTADGDFNGVLDPMAGNAGCFDPRKSYDPAVWTFPVVC